MKRTNPAFTCVRVHILVRSPAFTGERTAFIWNAIRISVYDKREDFNFKIVNFPYLDSNIPRNPAYGVYISQLVRYARICSRKDDFIYRHRRLSLKLQQQGYKYQQLMKSFHKFYRSHSDELKKFGTTLMELRSLI